MNKKLTAAKNNPWTTILGIIVLIAASLQYLLDNDPTTNPDWNIIFAEIAAGLGLLFARDGDVSSEKSLGDSKAG